MGRPSPGGGPDLGRIAEPCLELILGDQAWLTRRKHRVEFLEPGLVRHHITVDFRIPASAAPAASKTRWIPLFTLPKSPGDLFRFDYSDADGHSLPLPTRKENQVITRAMLITEAVRACVTADLASGVTSRLLEELDYVASKESQDAQGIIKNLWPVTSTSGRVNAIDDRADEARLAEDPRFWWLLRTAAHSSIVVDAVAGEPGDRVIRKLAYDQVIPDLSTSGRSVGSLLRSLSYRSGFRSLPVTFVIPWASARSFHFEVHAPEGLDVTAAGIRASQVHEVRHPHHAHLYTEARQAPEDTPDTVATPDTPDTAVGRVQVPGAYFRLPSAEYGLTAYGATGLVAVLMGLGALWPEYLLVGVKRASGGAVTVTSVSATSSILLLVPGLIATYLAGQRHPVARRLSALSRLCLLGTAAVAFAGAVRLTLISADHPTTASDLADTWLWPMFGLSAMATAVLLLRRCSGWFSAVTAPLAKRRRVARAKRRDPRDIAAS